MPLADEAKVSGELLMFAAVAATAVASRAELERHRPDVVRRLRRGAEAVIAGSKNRPKYAVTRDFLAFANDPGAESMAGEARCFRQSKCV